MSQAVSTINENKVHSISTPLNRKPCDKCGGNGYMKTSPNCYHTCLTCLGKGLLSDHQENIN